MRPRFRYGILLILLIVVLQSYATPGTAQTCPGDGAVNQDSTLTPADALLAFQQFLGLVTLNACQQNHANVDEPQRSGITPADALCIFQRFLSLAFCLDAADNLELTAQQGDGARVIVNGSRRLVAQLTTAAGAPASDIPVTFRLIQGDGTLSATLVTTDASGKAAATLTVGPTVSSYRVEASAAELSPVMFTVTSVAETHARVIVPALAIMGNTQLPEPGMELPEPLVVRVEDEFGNPVAGVEVTVEIISGVAIFVDHTPTLALQIQASDPEGDVLTFQATSLPPGLSISSNTGLISGTVAMSSAVDSPYQSTVTASDGTSDTTVALSWTVTPGGNLLAFESARIVGIGQSLAIHRLPVKNRQTGDTTFYNVTVDFTMASDGSVTADQLHSEVLPPQDRFIPGIYEDSSGNRYIVSTGGITVDGRASGSIRSDSSGVIFNASWVSGSVLGHPLIGNLDVASELLDGPSYGMVGASNIGGFCIGRLIV